jgi:hypothetical protein
VDHQVVREVVDRQDLVDLLEQVVAQDQVDHLAQVDHQDQVVHPDHPVLVVHPVRVDHQARAVQLDQVVHQVLVMMVLIQVDGYLIVVLWRQMIQHLVTLVLILQLYLVLLRYLFTIVI